jgi:hypothetical protein
MEEKYKGLINSEPFVGVFCGRKNSGKTFLLLKLLKDPLGYRNFYSEIHIISPTFRLQNIWQSISPEGVTVHESCDNSTIQYIYNNSKPHVKSLIIFDDCGQDVLKIDQSILNKFISNSRHNNNSIIFLAQKMSQLSTIVRTNTDMFVIFGANSTREFEIAYNEVGVVEKSQFRSMFNECTEKRYGCFVVSMKLGQLRFYDSFEKEFKI